MVHRSRVGSKSHLDPVCFIQAIRGTAVALRFIGWIVTIDEHVFAPEASAPADGEPLLNPILADRVVHLRLFRDPRVGAAGAFACMGLPFEEIADIQVCDVEADGSMVTLGRDRVQVSEELRVFLRAQRISRLRAAAKPDDQLFEGGWEGSSHLIARHVALMARVGLDLTNGSLAWKEAAGALAKDERWLAQRGVTIRVLRNARRRTPERLESDGTLPNAVETMRTARGGAVAADCRCLQPHAMPELLNESFDAYNRPVVGANHPWRNRR